MSHEIVKSNNNNNNNSNSSSLAVVNNNDWSFNNQGKTESPPAFDLKRVLTRRWKTALAIASTIFAGTALFTLLQTPKYQSQMLIKVNGDASVTPTNGNSENKQSTASSQAKGQNLNTEIQLLQSNPVLSDVSAELKKQSINLSVQELADNLSIAQAGSGLFPQNSVSDVLLVSYKDVNPERAKNILSVIGSTYVRYSTDRQKSRSTNAVKFVTEQLPKAEKELEQAAQALREFRQRHSINDADTYANQIGNQQQAIGQKIQQLSSSIKFNEQKYKVLRTQLDRVGQKPENALASSILSEDKVYQDIIARYNDVQNKYNQERSRFQDTYPTVEEFRLQLEGIDKERKARAQQVLGKNASQIDVNKLLAAGATQQNLTNELAKVETELAAQKDELQLTRRFQTEVAKKAQTLPQIQQAYADLQQRFKVKSEAVNSLNNRFQDLQISAEQESAPWKIIQSAYLPTSASEPNVARNLSLGLIAGSLLGLGTAMVQENLDKRVKQVNEARRITNLPLLGAIPKVPQPSALADSDLDGHLINSQNASFTESLRSLAMNLRYINYDEVNDEGAKTIAFTSAAAGEGKTTLTYNLGIVLAELGLRVLVVDANMRKAGIHELAKKSNEIGLSMALSSDRAWSEFVHVGEVENLDVIPAGPTPNNPVALLNSKKMRQYLKEWREAYDYVLIDTPTVGITADVQSLANQVDSIILINGVEHSSRNAVNHAMEVLHMTRCHLAGLVANFVTRSDEYYAFLDPAEYTPAFLPAAKSSKDRPQISGSI
jgi:capsular exopolysaccharide synthesis family protein